MEEAEVSLITFICRVQHVQHVQTRALEVRITAHHRIIITASYVLSWIKSKTVIWHSHDEHVPDLLATNNVALLSWLMLVLKSNPSDYAV